MLCCPLSVSHFAQERSRFDLFDKIPAVGDGGAGRDEPNRQIASIPSPLFYRTNDIAPFLSRLQCGCRCFSFLGDTKLDAG